MDAIDLRVATENNIPLNTPHVWPKMSMPYKRTIVADQVYIWHPRILDLIFRSVSYPLRYYTPPIQWLGGNWGVRRKIEAGPGNIRAVLAELHRGPTREMTRGERVRFFSSRGLLDIDVKLHVGSWHGDPTLSNFIGGYLIDHSPDAEGPLEWDYAKLERSEILDDNMKRIGKCRKDPLLAAVFLSMFYRHGCAELMECYKECV